MCVFCFSCQFPDDQNDGDGGHCVHNVLASIQRSIGRWNWINCTMAFIHWMDAIVKLTLANQKPKIIKSIHFISDLCILRPTDNHEQYRFVQMGFNNLHLVHIPLAGNVAQLLQSGDLLLYECQISHRFLASAVLHTRHPTMLLHQCICPGTLN